jgi:hypothetical protein
MLGGVMSAADLRDRQLKDALLMALYPGRKLEYLRLLYGPRLVGFVGRLRDAGYAIVPVEEDGRGMG